jgi:hypothetical protein
MGATEGSCDMTTSLKLTTSGPIFDKYKTSKVFEQARESTVRELVERGEQELDTKYLLPKPQGKFLSISEARKGQASTGNYRRNVHGITRRVGLDLQGKIHDSGVVYGPWLEGTSSRNKTTRFRGYSSFRKVKQWLEKDVAPNAMKKHIRILTMRMNHGV